MFDIQAKPLTIEISTEKGRDKAATEALRMAIDVIEGANPHLKLDTLTAKSNGPHIRTYFARLRPLKVEEDA